MLDLFKLNEISVVVVLAEEEECLAIAGCDLVEVYRHEGACSPRALAREARGLSGDDAIAWIRRLVPGAVETRGQEEVVRRYGQ